MQQRQLRLGDILDDYCPRERRVTNHAVVAMIGDDVKQTRCTTCDCDHEYKHAKVPRQRKKSDTPAALYAQVAASAPKRVSHETAPTETQHGEAIDAPDTDTDSIEESPLRVPVQAAAPAPQPDTEAFDDDENRPDEDRPEEDRPEEEGPAHRRLIRASLPRPEGQQPPARPIPEFTIRQPGNRPNRFRPRNRGGQGFSGGNNRSNGSFGGPMRGNMRPQGMPRMAKRHGGGSGRKRSK
jgi:hypothetical protein